MQNRYETCSGSPGHLHAQPSGDNEHQPLRSMAAAVYGPPSPWNLRGPTHRRCRHLMTSSVRSVSTTARSRCRLWTCGPARAPAFGPRPALTASVDSAMLPSRPQLIIDAPSAGRHVLFTSDPDGRPSAYLLAPPFYPHIGAHPGLLDSPGLLMTLRTLDAL